MSQMTNNTRKRRRSSASLTEHAEVVTTLPSPLPGGEWPTNADTDTWAIHHSKRMCLLPNPIGLEAQQPTFHTISAANGHIPPGPQDCAQVHPGKLVPIPTQHDVTFPSPTPSFTDPAETLPYGQNGACGPGHTLEYQDINRLLSQLHAERLKRRNKPMGNI
ncbi:hypothetical protein IWQ62_002585 [Dispira parvispora]|uniref:Uncharacterized protein n=1 Tax=Dispira parvispora TaxID=1520584 RepID=A0A9W8AWE9_9FUNG|nr:hypothetical protein IWQ62_002585 [Dispira parvispora]